MNAALDRLRAFVEAYLEDATQRYEMMAKYGSCPGNARAQGEMTALESVRYMIAAVGKAANPDASDPLPPVGSDAWAMAMLLQGKRVRRESWVPAVYICKTENGSGIVTETGAPASVVFGVEQNWEAFNA